MIQAITPLTQTESEFLNMLVTDLIKKKHPTKQNKRAEIKWTVYQTLRKFAQAKQHYVRDTQNRLKYLFETKEDAIVLWFMTDFTNQKLELNLPLHGTKLKLNVSISTSIQPNDDVKSVISAACVDDECNYTDIIHMDQFEDNDLKVYVWDDSNNEDYATKLTHNLQKIAKQMKE